MTDNWIINKSDLILITGASGFIGCSVFKILLDYGLKRLRCFVRSEKSVPALHRLAESSNAEVDFFHGNLLSQDDCVNAVKDAALIYHLAVGAGGKSFPSSFMSTVIPTRNLLEACRQSNSLKRFVNISSFAVYSNRNKPNPAFLDESCPIDEHPELRGDAYAFAKLKQDEMVIEYGKKYGTRYVIMRPGAVYGPGIDKITGRVGIDTFGLFLHLGGANEIPLTYVENCAEAIVLAGLVRGLDGEVFNIVDDDLPSSRQFLHLYKKNVRNFKSIYVPHAMNYFACFLWEKYSALSEGQLPPLFSRAEWHAYWKKTRYSNEKLKRKLGWKMKVPTKEGLNRYFQCCREGLNRA
jgi:nucleoside-diphosphate-sugar epimerase